MALKDDIDIPLCVVVGLLVAVVVAIAAIGTEAGFNYVDRREVYKRYEMMEKQRPELIFSYPIKKAQFEQLAKASEPSVKDGDRVVGVSLPIDQAIKVVAANRGAAPAMTYPEPASQPR